MDSLHLKMKNHTIKKAQKLKKMILYFVIVKITVRASSFPASILYSTV